MDDKRVRITLIVSLPEDYSESDVDDRLEETIEDMGGCVEDSLPYMGI